MADSENQQPVNQTVETTEQVTSKTSTTRPKNPKRVAVGKLVAENRKKAREAQKKALAEAQIIIANQNNQKKSDPPVADPPTAQVADPPVESESTRDVLTTTQWLSVISILFH